MFNHPTSPVAESLHPALRVKGLSFFYGAFKAIEGITLDVYQNQVTAMIGPSGCGKSTLLKALNRITELETKVQVKGSVEFFGQNIYEPKVNVNQLRRHIGMVFQRPNPFPMSIYENVAYGVKTHGRVSKMDLDEIVESSLRGAALWDEVKDKLSKSALGLSGGQQQRLCIARALAVKPTILLMDEPCSALDPIATLKIEELIKNLREQLTIVIVTHNMQQAARVSDYTAFMYMGELMEYAETRVIFNNPAKQQTRDYVAGRFG